MDTELDNCLIHSFQKVSQEFNPKFFVCFQAPSFKNKEEMLKLSDWSIKTFKDPVTNDDYEDTHSAFFLSFT